MIAHWAAAESPFFFAGGADRAFFDAVFCDPVFFDPDFFFAM